MSGWIAVDMDGTLAESHSGDSVLTIGKPIPRMVERVKRWLHEGFEVRICTARVGMCGAYSTQSQLHDNVAFADGQRKLIKAWCMEHIGQELSVTATKDFAMAELWDDRAVQVVPNTGLRVDGQDVDSVTLTRMQFDELVKDQNFLHRLQGGGVDNWDGYEHCLDSDDGSESEEDIYGGAAD